MEEKTKDKVEAIYELRAAAEQKARAELHADRTGTPEARDALLDATLDLEEKTQEALEVCHDCGQSHPRTVTDARKTCPGGRPDNVISVDFGAPPAQARP